LLVSQSTGVDRLPFRDATHDRDERTCFASVQAYRAMRTRCICVAPINRKVGFDGSSPSFQADGRIGGEREGSPAGWWVDSERWQPPDLFGSIKARRGSRGMKSARPPAASDVVNLHLITWPDEHTSLSHYTVGLPQCVDT